MCRKPLQEAGEKPHIIIVVLANCTDRLQPLDSSVNKPAKDYMRSKFQEWYSNQIKQQLEMEAHEEVDTILSVMKPIVSQWTIDMYNYFKSNPSIIVNGFNEAGIHDTLHL